MFLLCSCHNALYDGQDEGMTEVNGKSVIEGMDEDNGKMVPLFDEETIFLDIDDGTELIGILNEIVAGGQLYPVKTEDARKDHTISAVTKKGTYTIRKVIIDGQSALRIGNTYYQIGYVFINPWNGVTWEREGKSYGVNKN